MDTNSSRPIIGITCYVEEAVRGVWASMPHALLPHDYVSKVERAGGIAVLIPPRLDADAEMARAVLSRLDGVMLAGGVDIEPQRYAAAPHHSVQEARPDRDAFELVLAEVTGELDTPVLGVCRGMQVMAVASGGTLEQHLPDLVGHDEHSPAPGIYGSHPVRTVAGTRVSALLGREIVIPSYHHQSVSSHPGYVPAAWAPDGTLEAMEHPGSRFRLAVQWHPEVGQDDRLFDAFVQACARS
ncbi:MAG: putative glutamine amidotransferase [Actinomycetota bacterium]|jgi:putative glutamine amidotransferase|nr:putative glutamine amidotransferase [Actinomycetota bacterium]